MLLLAISFFFFLPFGNAQKKIQNLDYGANFHLRLRSSLQDPDGVEKFSSLSSTFKILPFLAKEVRPNWEIGAKGAFIWNRYSQEITRIGGTEKSKEDLFSLAIGPFVRRYFSFPKQRIQIFIDSDLKGFMLIGEHEISRVGVGWFGGVGVLYQLNDRIALESMVEVNIFRMNTLNMWTKGPHFYLGFRILNPFFGEQERRLK